MGALWNDDDESCAGCLRRVHRGRGRRRQLVARCVLLQFRAINIGEQSS